MRERLKQKRQRKEEDEFEAHAAAGMVLLAEERLKAKQGRDEKQASKQKSLVCWLLLSTD